MKVISRTIRRLALLLALAMLVTMQKIPVLAQGAENDGQLKLMAKIIDNPTYDPSKDVVTWDVIQFGSYPQTEVKGSALTSDIIGAAYDKNGDAWVDGVKYRRISKDDTNNDHNYGEYSYRFFKWESIKWWALKNDGETVFMVARTGLDCKNYHNTKSSVTWADCSLRGWLNDTFFNAAFSNDEKNAIVMQNVVNKDNPIYGTPGGKDTQDYVYLLSGEDMANAEYGFRESEWEKNSSFRQAKFSDYTYVMGAFEHEEKPGTCWYWLRTPGESAEKAIQVSCAGWVDSEYDVTQSSCAVRPALKIKLSYIPNPDDKTVQVGIPKNQAVKTGEKATFEVKTSGDGTNAYKVQWYSAPSQTAPGTKTGNETTSTNPATASLTVTAAPEKDGMYYYCVVSDAKSSVTSDRAKLTVYYPPTVSLVPGSLTVKIGEKKDIDAQVEGGNPDSYTYKWYRAASEAEKGDALDDLTESGIVVTPNSTNLDGKYIYCVVSNGQYEVVSNRVRITVTGSDQTPDPVNQEITYSASNIKNGKVEYGTKPFSLNAETSGDGGLSFASSDGKVLAVDSAGKVTVKGYGKATITITASATDNYKRASELVDITVVPKKVKITDKYIKSNKACFQWQKDSTVSGYQCSYAANKAFTKNAAKKSVKGTGIKLSVSDAAMYVRIRAYKKVGNQTYYGEWCPTLNIPKSKKK